MSMVLLVGAGLFAKSEQRTLHADPGYLPQKVVVSAVALPGEHHGGGGRASVSTPSRSA